MGSRHVVSVRDVARVLPHATKTYDGVLVRDLLGRHLSPLDHPRRAPQLELPTLGPGSVVDAQRDGDLTVLLAQDSGRSDRHLIRTDERGHETDLFGWKPRSRSPGRCM